MEPEWSKDENDKAARKKAFSHFSLNLRCSNRDGYFRRRFFWFVLFIERRKNELIGERPYHKIMVALHLDLFHFLGSEDFLMGKLSHKCKKLRNVGGR